MTRTLAVLNAVLCPEVTALLLIGLLAALHLYDAARTAAGDFGP